MGTPARGPTGCGPSEAGDSTPSGGQVPGEGPRVGVPLEDLLEGPEAGPLGLLQDLAGGGDGQSEEALKEIAGLIKLRPNDARLLVMAGDFLFQEQPAQAADYYRRALALDANNNHARVQLGASLVRSKQFEPALAVKLPKLPGTKEPRYTHLLGGEPATATVEERPEIPRREDRVGALEAEVAQLRRVVQELQEQFAEFRRQFD